MSDAHAPDTAGRALAQLEQALRDTAALQPRTDVVEPLDVDALEAQITQAERQLRAEVSSHATRSAYLAGLAYWRAWAHLRWGIALPMPTPPLLVRRFVLDHFGAIDSTFALPADIDAALVAAGHKARRGPLKITTIEHRLAVLGWLHRVSGLWLVSPTRDPDVRQLIRDCRKSAQQRGQRPRQKTPLLAADLDRVLETCDDSLEGRRDRALLLLGWTSGGRRRSEIAGLQVEDIDWTGDEGTLTMRRNKTWDTVSKPINRETAAALRAWLEAAAIDSGPIFRRLWHGVTVGPQITPHGINRIVKRRVERAGLTGNYGAHSIRRGFVTQAQRSGISISDTMAMTGHRSVKHLMGYADGNASAASDLLERTRVGRGERS